MRTTETINELIKALHKFQGEVGNLSKSAKNPFFKSDYAPLNEVLTVINKPLQDNGLCFVQFPTGEYGLTTRIMHTSGQWMEDTFEMKPTKMDPQGHGSSITYNRRYSLVAILGLNDGDDDGNVGSQKSPKNDVPNPATPTKQESKNLNVKTTPQADIPPEITLQELISHSTDQCTHTGKPFVKACAHQINDMNLHNITVKCPGCALMSKLVHGINSQQKPYVALVCENKHWYQYDSNEFKSAFKAMPKLLNAVQDYNNPLMNM